MREIAQILKGLFELAKGIPARTGLGLLQHGTGKYAIQAVEGLNFTVRGVKIGLKELSEEEQTIVKESIEYMTRFAYSYMQHHDESVNYRLQAKSQDELFWSHAREIVDAGTSAFHSRLRSHGYDAVVGKPKRVSVFQDEDVIKQLLLGGLMEIYDHLEKESKRKEKNPKPMIVMWKIRDRFDSVDLNCTQQEAYTYGKELLLKNPGIDEIRICPLVQGEVGNIIYNYINGYWIDEARRHANEDRRTAW